MTTDNNKYVPAILGGKPIRPAGPPTWPRPDPEIHAAVAEAMQDGSWGRYHGPHCDALTAALAELHDCEHVQLCASGTAAIELALRGMRIGLGDEVILAAYEYKPTFQNILLVGATPVLIDVRRQDCQLDVGAIEAAVTNKTRAIIASHLHGGVVDMPALSTLAEKSGLFLIEDACQCPGAVINARRAGMWGDVGVISFGGSKLLTAGRGGALTTRYQLENVFSGGSGGDLENV